MTSENDLNITEEVSTNEEVREKNFLFFFICIFFYQGKNNK